jgi:hypothetical protein
MHRAWEFDDETSIGLVAYAENPTFLTASFVSPVSGAPIEDRLVK